MSIIISRKKKEDTQMMEKKHIKKNPEKTRALVN